MFRGNPIQPIRRPDETAVTLNESWLSTGDLDDDGYLFVVDRKKDPIKPSGFQVWSRKVEEVIASHPLVDRVGVAGVPDPDQGKWYLSKTCVHAVKANWFRIRYPDGSSFATACP